MLGATPSGSDFILCGLPVRKSRARAFLAPCTRCNVCIATGPNVHVRFEHEQVRSERPE